MVPGEKPQNPILSDLKKGFEVYSKDIEAQKSLLLAKQKEGKLSETEESWLDNEGNTVDVQRLLDCLEEAENFESAYSALQEADKALAEKIIALASTKAKAAARKRMSIFFNTKSHLPTHQ
jgi:hypothetical protein